MAATASSSSNLPPQSFQPRPSAPLKSSSPRRIELSNLTPNNVGQLRKLNSVLFPVRYSEGFYKECLQSERKDVCKLALFNDMPVGNLVCRYDFPPPSSSSTASTSSSDSPPVEVYIMTLGILAPYRRLGIASKLIKHLLIFAGPGTEIDLPDPKEVKKTTSAAAAATTASKDSKGAKAAPVKTKGYLVSRVYLHVQTSNQEAIDFYKSQGFTEGEVLPEYYRKGVEPRSAVILEKKMD